jgi:hypothetical protein
LLLSFVLAACSSPGGPPRVDLPPVPRPMFQDQHLRSVRMTSGPALGYVQPETAGQILCQLLDKDEWERLLGGPVGRRPLNPPYAGCQIAPEEGMISLRLVARDIAFAATSTIASRPSTTDGSGDRLEITVALTDDALHPAPRQYFPARRLLEVQVVGHDAEFGIRVLEKIVPLLVRGGEALPGTDAQGHVQYANTPLTQDFVDLPTPVQALQLCTLLQENGLTSTRIDVRDTGECRLSTGQGQVTAAAEDTKQPPDYPDRVAGRPARRTLDPPVVNVRLRDDAEVELYVSAPDSVALAEKLVPLLVG